LMKHYGIWVKETPEQKNAAGVVLQAADPGGWAILENDVVFCTTSKGHAKAQMEGWMRNPSEVREFDDE